MIWHLHYKRRAYELGNQKRVLKYSTLLADILEASSNDYTHSELPSPHSHEGYIEIPGISLIHLK